ncbi:DUF5597 domain-containing protein [Daejeonia sp. YH14]|uniref:GH35 family beta-galactosidase n=1 Tax=Daejeonia sp. YH14 TaxID=3439042 RepID=UPI003F4967A8
MKKHLIFFVTIFWASVLVSGQSPAPHLQKTGDYTRLMVDNKPFLILGGELGNSSASSEQDIENHFRTVRQMNLNTVLVPAYWDLIEPEEGRFSFSLIDKSIEKAQKNQLKIVFLWFGAWKNSMSCYAPLWFKSNEHKYPRAETKTGKPLEIASAFSETVQHADNRAFAELLKHISQKDPAWQTVIMIQVENEVGMLEDARDYSSQASAAFHSQVPEKLIRYLTQNRRILHPWLLQKWQTLGSKTKGSWQEIFGNDLYTDEIFMAWHHAQYIQKLAETAHTVQKKLPLYVNGAMDSRNRKPGEYPSGGPLAHLIDIWHAAAPDIGILAPDLYDGNFAEWTAKYALKNNPLFIPEIKMNGNNGAQAFYAFGEYGAIGFSPFSIENNSGENSLKLADAYEKLKQLQPILTKYQTKDNSRGFLFDQQNTRRKLHFDDLTVTAAHFFTLPWDSRARDGNTWPDGGGLILRLAKNEYLIAGSGIVVTFEKETENKAQDTKTLGEDGFAAKGGKHQKSDWSGGKRAGIGTVDEISISEKGEFVFVRRLNGDQTHQGRHVRIGVDGFQILHVKLYEY